MPPRVINDALNSGAARAQAFSGDRGGSESGSYQPKSALPSLMILVQIVLIAVVN